MQTSKVQIKVQQAILTKYGFYRGKIDGIWGPSTIRAKKDFEADATFRPGFPNNGMPFSDRGPYPKGITLAPGTTTLHCEGIDEVLKEAAKAENFQGKSKPTKQEAKQESSTPETPGIEIVNVDESVNNDLGLDIASADSLTSTDNSNTSNGNTLRNNNNSKRGNRRRGR